MLLDFYNLIRDINGKIINKNGSKIIYLKYLEETEEEIKSFFHMAKKIFKGTKRLVPGKTAMETILERINLEPDITRKESDFFTKLTNMGILLSETIDIYDFEKFNIEDSTILEKYKDQKTEDEIVRTLKSFTYINIKRKGRNKEPFERVRHIILTGDYLVRKMSSDFEIKMENTDFSFATDIFYVTQRLWYKLNRGLGFSSKLPASLDVIRKAQIVISNQLKNHVRERYNKINDDLSKGTRTEEQVKDYYLRLRADNLKPEDITATNIDEKIDLIFCKDDLEDYLRNQSALKSKASEREELAEKIKSIELDKNQKIAQQKSDELNNLKENSIKNFKFLLNLFNGLILFICVVIILLVYYLKTEKDTPLQALIAILFLYSLLALVSYKKIKDRIKDYSFRNYLKRMAEIGGENID